MCVLYNKYDLSHTARNKEIFSLKENNDVKKTLINHKKYISISYDIDICKNQTKKLIKANSTFNGFRNLYQAIV